MRHAFIAIIIVTLIIGIGLFEQAFMIDTLKGIMYTCDEVLTALDSENVDSAARLLDTLTDELSRRERILELFFSHNEFRDMPALVGELQGCIASHNITESKVRTKVLRADTLSHINILSISVENIF